MGRGLKSSNLGYQAYREDKNYNHTPGLAAIPRNINSGIGEKDLRTLPTPSPTPLRDEEPDPRDEADPMEIIASAVIKRSAPETSRIPTGKRAKTKDSGGVPSRPTQSLATGESPQDTASITKRTANLMGLNKAFDSPQLSLSTPKPLIAKIAQQEVQIAITPEDAIFTTRSALTNMKSAIAKKDEGYIERHLLLAMETLWSLYDANFAPSKCGAVGQAMATDGGVLAAIEKGRKILGKEALSTHVSGVEGIKGLSPEEKMAKPGMFLTASWG